MSHPRQCPGCKTWYAPHVEKCECGKSEGIGEFNIPNGGMGETILLKETPSYTEGVVTPCTYGTTKKCEEGKHVYHIGTNEVLMCQKCGNLRDIKTS